MKTLIENCTARLENSIKNTVFYLLCLGWENITDFFSNWMGISVMKGIEKPLDAISRLFLILLHGF